MAALPHLTPSMSFDRASEAVVDYLKAAVPMGYWSVTRFDGTDQVYLSVRDDAYGMQPGDRHAWSDSLCQYSVSGRAPQIAPDAMAVPVYAAAGVARQLGIGAFVGLPIMRSDGSVFGTLCGLDPAVGPPSLQDHAPLLHLLTTLLATILEADLARTEAARRTERAELDAETDLLTGLYNRRGWMRFIALEEDRYRRYGDPGAVVVLDLDQLKQVNDLEGHAAGDRYIQRAAGALRATLRPADVAARLGGDEFGVLAARSPATETAALVGRLRTALGEAGVAGSIGHAPYTFVAGFPGAWAAADAAMYEEKARRRSAPTG